MRLSPRWIWWLVLVLATAVAALPWKAPGPVSDSAPPTAVSADRALDHIEIVAREPHPMGSPEAGEVREYLLEQLSLLDLEVDEQSFTAPDYFDNPGATVEAANVVARLGGANSSGAVLFIAHYDTVPTTPGANDDAAGVGTLLELARALSVRDELDNDIVFLFTDGEEPSPRFGATAFMNNHPWYGDVAFVVNLEATGGEGPSLLVELNGSETLLIDGLGQSDSDPAAYSFITETADLIGEIGTDFDPFVGAGIPGLHFVYVVGSPIYHTEFDTFESVSPASVQHHLNHVFAVAQHFGNSDFAGLIDDSGANYTTVGAGWILAHPDWVAFPVSVAALALLAWSGIRKRNAGRWLAATALALALFLVVAVAGALIWQLIASARPTIGVLESYAYFTALLAITTTGFVLMGRRRDQLVPGVLTLWALLGLAAALASPGISFVFAWPALAGAVWVFASGTASRVAGYATLALTVVVNLAWVNTLFLLAQPHPGNPGSQLLPLGGAALTFGALALLVVYTTMGEPAESPTERDVYGTGSPVPKESVRA